MPGNEDISIVRTTKQIIMILSHTTLGQEELLNGMGDIQVNINNNPPCDLAFITFRGISA